MGAGSVPRELIVEVRGRAGSLEEAAGKFQLIASPIGTLTGFTANVKVSPLQVHLAYESTAGAADRPFLEVFLPDEQGAVPDGRLVRGDLLQALCLAFFTLEKEPGQVSRALRQYELALREWYLGGEWLALGHLYMAVEALTEAVLRKARADGGFATTGELARSLGFNIEIQGPGRRDQQERFRGKLREKLIFHGDTVTYQAAKKASDGLEHGAWELDEVARYAVKHGNNAFRHVRQTIIELLGLPGDAAANLMAIGPKDVQSRRKVIRGRLTGTGDDLAAEGQLYPLLEWESRVGSATRDDSAFHFTDTDKITVRTHPNVTFHFDQLLAYGPADDGQVPVQADSSAIVTRPVPEPRSARLLTAVIPLVNAATASTAETRQPFPQMLAFNLFGQAVASFEAAQLLIGDGRPVEALPALGNLVIIASRFEQVTDKDGPGIGIILRMALDTPQELGASADASAAHREQVQAAAASAGILVLPELPVPDRTTVFAGLRWEMLLARSVANGTYAAIGPHLKHEDGGRGSFYTQVEPGTFTELVASACVIAQLQLLKSAAQLFNWRINQQEIDALLAEARELNDESANP
jgi:hypothetical protein